ncbi:MAG: UTP--glucose-1-phosphate uridylyltransferase [Verrucomicrobiota bacterium]
MTKSRITEQIEKKMREGNVAAPAITAFLGSVEKVIAGESGMISESSIDPVQDLPHFDSLPNQSGQGGNLLNQLAVIKLTGGLGTSMGLDRVKSLIRVKGEETFLDFIARQILHLRSTQGAPKLAFYLMDSFSTQEDTLSYLQKYPELASNGELDFLQSKVPKLDAQTLEPVSWPADPELEWCPPGHGDLYPSLLGCGLLDGLLARGVKFLFVSNADNLGATVDAKLLSYFAHSGWSFLMEVAGRTGADRKGGHLARRRSDGRLLLRESAQVPKTDEAAFQDVERHRYFNTNNLWIRLDHLKEEMTRRGGALPLALITNTKTVDPRDANSPKVLQLECAMGAAIECFEKSGAVVVPRSRFAPVKTTADLLTLRSDAYRVTEDFRLVLDATRRGQPPLVELDSKYFKLLADFETRVAKGAPSLLGCESLKVTGDMAFASGVVVRGRVEFCNPASELQIVPSGTYEDRSVGLPA